MNHSEFVSRYRNHQIAVHVDKYNAGYFYGIPGLMPKYMKAQQVRSRRLVFIGIFGGIVLFFFTKWYFALPVVLFGFAFAPRSQKLAAKHVLEASLADPKVYEYALSNDTLTTSEIDNSLSVDSSNNSKVEDSGIKAKRSVKVIQDFGAYVEDHPSLSTDIKDVSLLPHPKEEILNAILFELAVEDDENLRDVLKFGANMLPEFQENVGAEPLRMFKIDKNELNTKDPEKMMQILKDFAYNPDKERYESLSEVVEKERSEIKAKILAVEEKRFKVLGKR